LYFLITALHMTLVQQLTTLALAMVLLMSIGWLWQRHHSNAGIVDVLWSAGLGFGAVLMAITGSGAPAPRWLVALLGGGWAVRLALHLWHRVSGEQEDGRYQQLRRHWQVGTQWKFYAFFQAQALLVVIFSLPFAAAARNPIGGLTPSLCLGILFWVVGVSGESIADAQLARFRRDPANRGRVCRVGLWRYSRHPNYFFEWLHWFTYVALAWGASSSWLAWLGPVLMYVFLRWISGIPFTEAQGLRTRGADYREYQRTTSLLIPWLPKSSSSGGNRS
jgi:steroid 5-alpha reductase family enzyme